MADKALLQSEQDHQRKAFEQYYALGEKRSYARLARELGVSRSTIKLWSRSFNWRQRVHERDAEVARKVADRAIHVNADGRSQNQKIVQMALIRLAKAIADGKVRMQLGDLERLIRLQKSLEPANPLTGNFEMPITAEELMHFMDNVFSQVTTGVLHQAIELLTNHLQTNKTKDESV